MPSRLVLI